MQLYSLGGVGPAAALRVLRHGLAVDEVAVAPLEANPNAVWTVKRHVNDAHDSLLVVSFVNATLVLSIGGESVEEVSDSGLLGSTPTLMVALIGDDALLQAHAGGLRHVRGDKRVHEWKAPGRKPLTHAACNGQQAVVALAGGELYYFELDALGQLREVQKHDLGKEVAAVSLAPLAGVAARARFVAVADFESSVQVCVCVCVCCTGCFRFYTGLTGSRTAVFAGAESAVHRAEHTSRAGADRVALHRRNGRARRVVGVGRAALPQHRPAERRAAADGARRPYRRAERHAHALRRHAAGAPRTRQRRRRERAAGAVVAHVALLQLAVALPGPAAPAPAPTGRPADRPTDRPRAANDD